MYLWLCPSGAQEPTPDKAPITGAHNLFFKIKVRPRSCRSYPIWRPSISWAFVFIRMYLSNSFTIAWNVQAHENKKIPSELISTHFAMWSKTHHQTLLVFHTHSVTITVSYLVLLGIQSALSIRSVLYCVIFHFFMWAYCKVYKV